MRVQEIREEYSKYVKEMKSTPPVRMHKDVKNLTPHAVATTRICRDNYTSNCNLDQLETIKKKDKKDNMSDKYKKRLGASSFVVMN